jgi:PAS domain S-box-containing protein
LVLGGNLSFREQEFTIYYILGKNAFNDKCNAEIEGYFKKVLFCELSTSNFSDLYEPSGERNILLVDDALPVDVQDEVLKFYTNKIPIILISESVESERAIELLGNGIINNICFTDQSSSIITSLLRELKGLLMKSQLQILSEQSTLMSEAVLNTQTAVLTTDSNGSALWVNKAHTKLTGFTIDEMIGKKSGQILQGPETDPKTVAFISQKLKEQVAFSTEIINYHKNGEKVWLKLDITPIFKNDKLDRFIAFQEDITEKKQNEQRLAESLKRLQDAQRIGKMCDWVMDADTFQISWSGRAAEILELEDISGFDYWQFRRQLSVASRQKLQSALIEMKRTHKDYDLVLDFNSTTGDRKVLRSIGVPVFENDELIRVVGIVQDITEQYEAEMLALKAQQHLTSVTTNMQAGVCRIIDNVDSSRELIFANQGFYDMFEVSEEEVKSDFMNVMKLLHPDDKVLNIHEIFAEVQKTGQAVDQYFRIITKSGKLKWMHLISNATAGSKGNIIHDFIITDITEQYEAERLANKSQQQLKTVTENMQAGVARIIDKADGSRDIVFANNGFYELYEVDEETAKTNFGLIYNQTHDEDNVMDIDKIFEEYEKTGKAVNQYFRIITPSGKLKWIHLISNPSKGSNGDIIHDFIVADITSRIQKDRLLEEISEVSLNGGWELDVLTNKLTWTDVTKQIHEVPEDFEPDVETVINFYKEGESRERITEFFNEVFTTGKSRDGHFEIITAKGNHKWVRAKGAAEYAGDQIVRVYGFFQDITDAIKRENAIIESLNEKNALLGEIHHRVKNNLAVISGLLQLELMKGDDAKLSLEDAVNRIQSIAAVHEILYNTDNFSVIYLDKYLEKLTLNIAKTNPSFISDIKLESEIENVGISINQAVPVGLLLNELITNSLKHAFNGSNKGSITISVSNTEDSSVKLNYSDSGSGFDEKLLEKGNSLGYKLINSLLLQLEADFNIKTKDGFELECNFKTDLEEATPQLAL